MNEEEMYYFSHENFGELFKKLKAAQTCLSSSYAKLEKL